MTSFATASHSGLVPLFPLPDSCLLPGELQPFQIFEPRYRRMLAEALAADGLLALPRFCPGWEDAYHQNPPVEPRFGVGKVVSHALRPDGTSEIVVLGIARVRLVAVVRELPVRLARVIDLPERVCHPGRLDQVTRRLESILSRAAADPASPCYRAATGSFSVSELPGRLTCLMQFDSTLKQAILEADDLVERLELVSNCLSSGHLHHRAGHPESGLRSRNPSFN